MTGVYCACICYNLMPQDSTDPYRVYSHRGMPDTPITAGTLSIITFCSMFFLYLTPPFPRGDELAVHQHMEGYICACV